MSIRGKSAFRIVAFLGLAYMLIVGSRFLYTIYIEAKYAKLYTPLNVDVARDLCTRLHLPQDEKACLLEEPVYAIQFSERIDELQLEGSLETHSDWHALLEPYEECLPVFQQPNPTHNYFICKYDFGGNKEFYYEIWFRENGELRNIFYRSPYESN